MAIRQDEQPTERVERVERIERVHDEPAMTTTRTTSNVSIAGTPTPKPVLTVTSVVTLFFTVLEVLLLLRFIFKLAGANANQALVAALYDVTEPLTRPFQGIFAAPQGPPVIDQAALLAIVFLFLVAALVVALVRAITAPRAV
jgi:uncharacterized protein YggT (Ycf19 family)